MLAFALEVLSLVGSAQKHDSEGEMESLLQCRDPTSIAESVQQTDQSVPVAMELV